MHLVAIARAAGITLSWDDISDLSAVVPLLARVYPNGKADVNHFHAAGGMACVINSLLDAGSCTRTCGRSPVTACAVTPPSRSWPARGWVGLTGHA